MKIFVPKYLPGETVATKYGEDQVHIVKVQKCIFYRETQKYVYILEGSPQERSEEKLFNIPIGVMGIF